MTAPVQAYAKSHGINLKGRHTYPNFWAYKPSCLQEVLSAAVEVADKLKTNTKEQLGFHGSLSVIPLLCPDENGYTWEPYQMPELVKEECPSPEFAIPPHMLQLLPALGTDVLPPELEERLKRLFEL